MQNLSKQEISMKQMLNFYAQVQYIKKNSVRLMQFNKRQIHIDYPNDIAELQG